MTMNYVLKFSKYRFGNGVRLFLGQGQTFHRTEVIDKLEKQNNKLIIGQTNLHT